MSAVWICQVVVQMNRIMKMQILHTSNRKWWVFCVCVVFLINCKFAFEILSFGKRTIIEVLCRFTFQFDMNLIRKHLSTSHEKWNKIVFGRKSVCLCIKHLCIFTVCLSFEIQFLGFLSLFFLWMEKSSKLRLHVKP